MAKPKPPYIRASDVGHYVFCRRAWWLRRVAGFEQEDVGGRMARGTVAHARHGRTVRRSRWQQKAALFCLILGGLLFGLVVILLLFQV